MTTNINNINVINVIRIINITNIINIITILTNNTTSKPPTRSCCCLVMLCCVLVVNVMFVTLIEIVICETSCSFVRFSAVGNAVMTKFLSMALMASCACLRSHVISRIHISSNSVQVSSHFESLETYWSNVKFGSVTCLSASARAIFMGSMYLSGNCHCRLGCSCCFIRLACCV